MQFYSIKDLFQEQTEDTPEKLMEIGGASHQPLREEVADEKAGEVSTYFDKCT